MKKAVIFGSGKIARGFIAQLLYRSGYHITFAEINKELVQKLNEAGRYYVNVMGHEEESEWISQYHCLSLDEIQGIADALSEADIAFTSVGGKNLLSLSAVIADAFQMAEKKQPGHVWNIVTCENWKNPALQLQSAIMQRLEGTDAAKSFEEHVGVTEAVIMRSGVEAAPAVLAIDENAVSVTDFWELPVHRDKYKINF